MAERSVVVRLRAEVSDYKRKLGEAKKATEDAAKSLGDYVGRNEQAVNTLSNSLGRTGLVLTAFAGLAVKKFADFDQAMSNVQAATREGAEAMAVLRDAALQAGQRTVYSATEAAGAIENLGKAGLSTQQILAGGLDGALDLAAASTMDVADAAEITAAALKQFGRGGDEAQHVADLLAAGAGKAQGEVYDLGMALKQSGVVANQMGVSLEETVGTLTAFADAGMLGSDAGTSLRAMLLRLANPTGEAAARMKSLGIEAYDAQGNFVGMEGLAGQLENGLKDLTQEQRNAALAIIFGQDAIRSASILYEQGAAGIASWTDKVDDSGYAAEVAATRLDNLKGDLEQLGGAAETALIGMGEGANGPLRALVQSVTDVVNAFSGLPGGVQQGTLALVGGGGLVALGTAGLGKLLVGINDVRTAMTALGVSGKTAGLAMGGIGAVITIAVAALGSWASTQAAAKAHMDALTQSIDKQTGAWTDLTREEIYNRAKVDPSWWSKMSDGAMSVSDAAEEVGLSLETVVDASMGLTTAQKEIDALSDSINGSSSASLEQIKAINQLSDWVVKEQGVMEDARDAHEEYNEVVLQGGEAQDDAAASAESLATAAQYVGQSAEEATTALEGWRETVSSSDQAFIDLQNAYQGVIDKNMEFAQASADASDTAEDSWEDFYDGYSVSASEYIAQLQEQVDAQSAWEQNMIDITARVAETMPADMQAAADAMIDELLALGPEGAAQVQLLHDMTDAELAQVVSLWSQRGTDAVAEFTTQVENYRNPVIELEVDDDPAYAAVDRFIRTQSGRTIYLNMQGQEVGFKNGPGAQAGLADGGSVPGPYVGPRADNVLIRATPREYMQPVAAHDFWGTGFMDAVRRRDVATVVASLPGYADGGPIAYAPAAWAGGSGGSSLSLAGLVLEGTLDLGGGLTGQMRAVVREELTSAQTSRTTTLTQGRPR